MRTCKEVSSSTAHTFIKSLRQSEIKTKSECLSPQIQKNWNDSMADITKQEVLASTDNELLIIKE